MHHESRPVNLCKFIGYSATLLLIITVVGVVYSMIAGVLTAEILGSFQFNIAAGAGGGVGLAGILIVCYLLMRQAMKAEVCADFSQGQLKNLQRELERLKKRGPGSDVQV